MAIKFIEKSEFKEGTRENIELYDFQKKLIREWLAAGNIGVITWRSNL